MKEFISNAYQKAVVATGAVLTAAVPAFAEGEPAAESLPQGLDATLLTSYSEAVTENMVSVLKTFAVIRQTRPIRKAHHATRTFRCP